MSSPALPLAGTTILVTGIADSASLAMEIARHVQAAGANLAVAGLGRTAHHSGLTEKAAAFLDRTQEEFRKAVLQEIGGDVPMLPLDVTIDATVADAAASLRERGIVLDGVVHAIAMDKTIRAGTVKPLLEVSRDEFFSAMEVSAYSLISLTRELLAAGVLKKGSSLVALSYLGAERIVQHPYRNIGVAKAALERIALELAHELGRAHAIRVNVVRFSPYAESRAGSAIEGLAAAVERCQQDSPLGNARPQDLATEVAHLLRPSARVTGEIRHVDGGFHIRA